MHWRSSCICLGYLQHRALLQVSLGRGWVGDIPDGSDAPVSHPPAPGGVAATLNYPVVCRSPQVSLTSGRAAMEKAWSKRGGIQPGGEAVWGSGGAVLSF